MLEEEYQLEYFKTHGLTRNTCRKCGAAFWTRQPERDICGDAPCEPYSFIGNPVFAPHDLDSRREAFLSFHERHGHSRIDRYPDAARWRDDIYLYTVTSEVAGDLDSTNFNLTITTYGGPVLETFYGMVDGLGSNDSIRIGIVHSDDLSYIGRNLFHNFQMEYQRTTRRSIGGIVRFDGLPAGTHSFKVVWGCSGGTGTLYVAHRPRFCVIGW